MLSKRFFIYFLLLWMVPSFATAKIVFESQRHGGQTLYVMDDDGSNVQRLTFTRLPHYDSGPVWSPNGKRIAFLREISEDRRQQKSALFIMNSDGSQEQQITDFNVSLCSWSPDGSRIAYGKDRNIYVIDIFTRAVRKLTNNPELTSRPSWSPNGKYIAYRQAHPAANLTTIYVMNANGSGQHPLVPHDNWYRFSPAWSPDSKSVMYVEALYGNEHAFQLLQNNVVIQKHGSPNRRFLKIPTKKWLVHSACWMDNGKQVLIAAEEHAAADRQIEIYRYHLVTGEITNLTSHPRDDLAPHWIDDDVLSVTPQGKKKVRWGTLKK